MKNEIQNKKCCFRLFMLVATYFLMLPVTLLGQVDRTLVTTNFVMPDSIFPDIGQEARNQIADNISKRLADHCNTYHSFLQWTPNSENLNTSTDKTSLILNLTGKKNTIGLWGINLQFTGDIQGKNYELFKFIGTTQLFSPFDDQPSHNPEVLQQAIFDKLDKQFFDEGFRKNLHHHFLNKIPITKVVHPDLQDKRIVIPVLWESLKASTESVLFVEFVVGSDAGNMELIPQGPIYEEHWKGYVQCLVSLFRHPPDEFDKWDIIIPGKLQNVSKDSLNVFMAVYDQNLNPVSIGSTLIDP